MTVKEKVEIAVLDEKLDNIMDLLKGSEGLCSRMTKVEKWMWVASGGSVAVFFIIDKIILR